MKTNASESETVRIELDLVAAVKCGPAKMREARILSFLIAGVNNLSASQQGVNNQKEAQHE